MNKMRLEESIAVTAGLLMLFASPAISQTQSAGIAGTLNRDPNCLDRSGDRRAVRPFLDRHADPALVQRRC